MQIKNNEQQAMMQAMCDQRRKEEEESNQLSLRRMHEAKEDEKRFTN